MKSKIDPNTGFFKHPQALVESEKIGKGTRVWAFAHILPDAVIGEDCNICDHTFIENNVVVGNRVTVKCGVQLWDGLTLEDDVFIGPNVTFTNDPFPRSRKRPKEFSKTLVQKGASIGANATILPGLVIGRMAMVGAGAVVTRDVPPHGIVAGNPARLIGFDGTGTEAIPSRPISDAIPAPRKLLVPGVEHREMPVLSDSRGSLSFGEFDKHLPFPPVRYFLLFDLPDQASRGGHAHKKLHQFMVCVKGSCRIALDDGKHRDDLELNTPRFGLYIKSMVWVDVYECSADATLLVLASDVFKEEDYIRNYDAFLKAAGA